MTMETRVKGTVLSGLLRAAEASAPGPLRTATLDRVPEDLREAAETGTIDPLVWYPVAWHRDLLGALVHEIGATRTSEAVRKSARANVGLVHRALMRAFSPATLMARTAMIFRSFFDAECACTLREPGVTVVRWSGCHGFDRNCWLGQLATVDELVSMTGAKQLGRRVVDGGQTGDSTMVVEISWAP